MPAMEPWFNSRKVAQVVTFFARQDGGSINTLKLAKLLYLADRTNLDEYEFPITWDNYVAMPHGPVNSITQDCVNGMYGPNEDWDTFVGDRQGYNVSAAAALSDDELDELSEAELGTLHSVWNRFGSMEKYQLRDWTHANCPEWEDPHGSSNPIPLGRMLKFLGKSHANELEADLLQERKLKAAFA